MSPSRLSILSLILSLGAVPARSFDDIKFLPSITLEDVARPGAVAASLSRVYLIDEKKDALLIYNDEGKLIKSVGRSGSDKTGFSGAKGLAVASDGRVYVADTDNSRVQMLTADGEFLGSFGGKGSAMGQMKYPQSVAVGTDGRVYVADSGNGRINVYTDEGVFLYAIGKKGKMDGEIDYPARVMVDPGDNVFVLDSGNTRIARYNARARFESQMNLMGTDFVVDAFGFFYVLDPRAYKVREQDPAGTMQGVFGSKGNALGQFKNARSIGISPDGTICVVDQELKRVLRVQLTSKLKTATVPPDPAPRLSVAGPTMAWKGAATALAAREDMVFAYMSKEGNFVGLDKAGKIGLVFGKAGKDEQSTRGSRGFAASEKHGFFVSDTDGDKLQRFDSKGNFLMSFAASSGFFDSKKKEGRVKAPQGAAVNEKGMLYVANVKNKRVEVFSKEGAYLFSIGPNVGPLELQEPVGVAWDKAGFVYILDKSLKKILKCEPSGGFVLAWGEPGDGPTQLQEPVALAFDGQSYVFVLDRGAGRVSVFGQDGTWVTNFFAQGRDDRGLEDPAAIAVLGSELFIADPDKSRVASFALHPRLAPPVALSSTVVEGIVTLKWKPSTNAWADGYRILRSTSLAGHFDAIATTVKPEYQDTAVVPYQGYFYRVATLAKTMDVGVPTAPLEVFVPGQFNRAPVEITSVEIGNIFSASYKYYEKNPVGTLTLINNVNVPFQNVKVTFRLKDFMDFGTDTVIAQLGPQEKKEIPLMAVLNNRILDVTEHTPIQAEFALTYYENGKLQTVSLAKPLRVFSRNAITWDKPERLAAFVTVNDTPVKDFERKVANEPVASAAKADALPENVVTAIKLWEALGAAGIKFQQAPNNPFEEISKNPTFPVDITQFPRETLKRKSGQCDDLASLFVALFEAAGVKAAFLNYPGHIAVMFDTGSSDPLLAGVPESQLILYNNSYWMPIEATLVGSSFADAHHHAVNGYREMEKKGKASIIDPRQAWASFEPVTMQATDWTPETPATAELAKRVDASIAAYSKERYEHLAKHWSELAAKAGKDPEPALQLGILDIETGKRDKAAEQFQKVLALDPANASAMNNLGSIAFLDGDFAKASSWFDKAAKEDPTDPGIWVNLAKTAAKTKSKDKVKEYGAKAAALEPSMQLIVDALLR
ncbi:MAG: tetratricopeptide repeat protein [Elusimicrobia bacterium]|nr:tetratricopeptide repeat protein [Elusimicrobiota bacterium]